MVDFRVNVVRPAGQYDAPVTCLIQEFNCFFPLFAHVFPACFQLFPCLVNCILYIIFRNRKFPGQLFCQAFAENLFTLEGEEGMDKIYFPVHNRIHVVLNIFRIRGYNRAVVMIVGILKLISLMGNGGVEDARNSSIYQPLHMSVC